MWEVNVLKDKKIGVLMGGTSSEREISLRSGAAVYKALKGLQYNAIQIDVAPDICTVLGRDKIDIAFLVLHGGYGENGSMQGMLEVLGIPYTGSGVLASALAMNKEMSKKIFLYHKIPVPSFSVFDKTEEIRDLDFPFPWVVKPVSEGSSVGVNIVRDKKSLSVALENARGFGSRIIIERYIEGKEVHIGILNGKVLGGVEVRPSLEFYNYQAKYTSGLTEYVLPPEINKEVYEKAKDVALAAHRVLGCKGATRVDLKIDLNGNPYVLEINTIPGMTETSLLPKIAGLAGIEFPGLIEEILKGIYYET